MSKSVEQVFARLDRWRHLPKYQLERRADIFFSLYLAEVIERRFGVPVEETMIPEFPLKKPGNNQSTNVDYLVFAKDRSRAFLVELKTDDGSTNAKQDEYLLQAEGAGFSTLVADFTWIATTTKADRKYGHLLHLLSKLSCIDLPDDLLEYMYRRDNRRGLTELREKVRVTVHPDEFELITVFVVPTTRNGGHSIDFAEFAETVRRYQDPLSKEFARCLERWVSKAGHVPPDELRAR